MVKRSLLLSAIALAVPLALSAQAAPLTFSMAGWTSNFTYTEPADQYLDVWGFSQITDPVVFLKLASPANSGAPGMGDPYDLGMGAWLGSMYAAGHYGFQGYTKSTVGPFTNEVDTLISSGDNTITGKRAVITSGADYTVYSYNNPTALFGFKAGNTFIGVYESFVNSSQTNYATFNPTGTVSTSTTTLIKDNAGAVSYQNSDVFALGTKGNGSYIQNTLAGGLTMPLGSVTLRGGLSLFVKSTDNSTSYGEEKKVIQTGAGYASYTPSAALPESTAAAIANLQYWKIDLENYEEKPLEIEPDLSFQLDIPVDFLGNEAVFSPGLGYALTATIHKASLKSETGADLSASSGWYWHIADYTNSYNATTGFYETKTTTTYGYAAKTYSSDMANSITIPLTFKVTPNPGLRFAIAVQPTVEFGKSSYSYSAKQTVTTVIDNGNGIAAATDAGDSTSVTTTIQQPYTYTESNFGLKLDIATAFQYYIFPNKLRLNLGASASTQIIDRTTATKTFTGLGSDSTATTVAGATTTGSPSVLAGGIDNTTTTDSGVAETVNYKVGLTLFASPNVLFDFYMNNSKALNLLATTDNGGFFNLNNYTVQLTIKLPPNK